MSIPLRGRNAIRNRILGCGFDSKPLKADLEAWINALPQAVAAADGSPDSGSLSRAGRRAANP
jgi:hypothetical protein